MDEELTPYEQEQALFNELLEDAIEAYYKKQSRLPKDEREPFFYDRKERRAFTGKW